MGMFEEEQCVGLVASLHCLFRFFLHRECGVVIDAPQPSNQEFSFIVDWCNLHLFDRVILTAPGAKYVKAAEP
jgi:hypothetical protein